MIITECSTEYEQQVTDILSEFGMGDHSAMRGIVMIALAKDLVLACAALDMSHPEMGCWLNCCATRPCIQRMGIGRQLVETLVAQVPSSQEVWLETESASRIFYLKCGFGEVPEEGIGILFASDPRSRTTTLLMRRFGGLSSGFAQPPPIRSADQGSSTD